MNTCEIILAVAATLGCAPAQGNWANRGSGQASVFLLQCLTSMGFCSTRSQDATLATSGNCLKCQTDTIGPCTWPKVDSSNCGVNGVQIPVDYCLDHSGHFSATEEANQPVVGRLVGIKCSMSKEVTVANLIPSLAALKVLASADRIAVRNQIYGRKATVPAALATVRVLPLVIMDRSKHADFTNSMADLAPQATVSPAAAKAQARAEAKAAARTQRAAEKAFVKAIFNFIGFWEACSLAERATMAKKVSTASRARLIASDVLAPKAVATAPKAPARARWAHVVAAPETTPAQRAAMTRKGKAAAKAAAAAPAWRQVQTEAQIKAAKALAARRRSIVAVVMAKIGSLLASRAEVQEKVTQAFTRLPKKAAFLATESLRSDIACINEQIERLVWAMTTDSITGPKNLRVLSFRGYRLVMNQKAAAHRRTIKELEREAKRQAWLASQESEVFMDLTLTEDWAAASKVGGSANFKFADVLARYAKKAA